MSLRPTPDAYCETALWLFLDVDRGRKLKAEPEPGWATIRFRDWTAIRLSGATATLPFASRLMALSTTGHWTVQAFVEGEIPFSAGSSNDGFWSRKVENALSFNGD
jgi:hypothetical protein